MESDDLTQRIAELGARVNGHPENVDEVVPQLLALLDAHDDPRVIAEIIDALGSSWDESANLAVLTYARHPDPAIRLAVTRAIPGGTDSRAGMELVANALIRLSRDDADEIRDWATFGLGSNLPIDNDEVREALVARLADVSADVRDEALVGLAHRRDRRAVNVVADSLADDTVGPLVFEAAEYLADPALYEALVQWSTVNSADDLVLRALRACDREYQASRLQKHTALLAALEQLLGDRDPSVGAAMSCDRDDVKVLLRIDGRQWVWSVEALLERARDDVDEAARDVVARLDAELD
ncbi:MAG TPA: HEAT repeat domain-containing protein [Acidimicrobiia bacterium]|nr:HEAT repeat domain-containing protein [Acidimicrobiia bacterium]